MHAMGLTNTGPARAAAERRFYDMVDPDGNLTDAERERRVRHAKSAYFAQLARKRWGK
jgi:hypothetical protein